MSTFLTPNRHGYSVRFSPTNPNRLVVATSQFFGLAGGGTLFFLEQASCAGIGGLNLLKTFQWSDGLFDVVSTCFLRNSFLIYSSTLLSSDI